MVATCLGILAFIPWALSVAPNLYRVRTSVPIYGQASIMSLVNSWVLNLNRILIDFDQGWCVPVGDSHCNYPLTYSNPLLYLLPFTFLLIAYAIYFLWRHTLRETWLFLIPLMGVTAMALILPDFVLGGSRSSMMRYTIPSILGIQISLAYCLLTQIIQASGKRWKRNLWRTILVAVISLSFYPV